jgi:AhpD family alkylhydroperoxidase
MMLDWNGYQKQLGGRLGELSKLSPDTLKGYMTLSAANSQTSRLGEKTRQLISLAVAVTTHCDGCIVFHTDAALKAGASKEEISEALGVAVAMNAGATLIYSTRVLDAVEAKSAAASAND